MELTCNLHCLNLLFFFLIFPLLSKEYLAQWGNVIPQKNIRNFTEKYMMSTLLGDKDLKRWMDLNMISNILFPV